MADTLTTITNFINSPPGQWTAGALLAGIVWKCFEKVESVLTDDTKLEIAVWLLGRKKFGPKITPWPDTFAKMFDRVFGAKHLSWTCASRSIVVTLVFGLLVTVFISPYLPNRLVSNVSRYPYSTFSVSKRILEGAKQTAGIFLTGKALADYVALLATRIAIYLMTKAKSALVWATVIAVDFCATVYISLPGVVLGGIANEIIIKHLFPHYYVAPYLGWRDLSYIAVSVPLKPLMFLKAVAVGSSLLPLIASSYLSSFWLWLYAGSGFLLKLTRHFDIGFEWFNRHFDIEHKPLSAIGLVAGALVALVWWVVVVVRRYV